MKMYLAKIPLLLGLFILLLTIPLSLRVITQKSPVNPKLKAQDINPSLSLFPQNINAQINQEILINLNLNSQGKEMNGLDLSLRYNPFLLQINQSHSQLGTIFSSYPGRIMVDQKVGLLSISGRGNFIGKGLLAKISFLPLSKGKGQIALESIVSGQIKFDYQGSTINVTE